MAGFCFCLCWFAKYLQTKVVGVEVMGEDGQEKALSPGFYVGVTHRIPVPLGPWPPEPERALSAARVQAAQGAVEGEEVELDAESRRQLCELGYLTGEACAH